MTETNYNVCSIQGCTRKHKAKGFCAVHYKTHRRRELNNGALPSLVTPRKLVQCQHCGVSYKPKATDRITFCSKTCAGAARTARSKNEHPPFSYVYTGFCLGCRKAIISRVKRDYCDKECYPSETQRIEASESLKSTHATKVCLVCGKPCGYALGMGRPKLYCSKECRHKSETFKDGRRASKARRRAIIKGATVETVKPFKVFDRDRWTCQLCGTKTPKGKRNTLSDDAPELDHIIPISKGGAHSYMNTQCTCRKCNGAKSDKPLGQLLMFG